MPEDELLFKNSEVTSEKGIVENVQVGCDRWRKVVITTGRPPARSGRNACNHQQVAIQIGERELSSVTDRRNIASSDYRNMRMSSFQVDCIEMEDWRWATSIEQDGR